MSAARDALDELDSFLQGLEVKVAALQRQVEALREEVAVLDSGEDREVPYHTHGIGGETDGPE